MTAAVIDQARRIVAKHTPRGEGSWQSCRMCDQASVGGSETVAVWPCDARRLADALLAEHEEQRAQADYPEKVGLGELMSATEAMKYAAQVLRELQALCDKHSIPNSVLALGALLDGNTSVALERGRIINEQDKLIRELYEMLRDSTPGPLADDAPVRLLLRRAKAALRD